MSIAENLHAVQARVAAAALRSGREPGEIVLVGATKMNDAGRIQEAIGAGLRVCGENRVQEFLEKEPQGAYRGAEVHFIGHLQKNKVKHLVGKVSLIQSVDSLELLALISRLALERGLRQQVLLEVNVAGEAAKSGFRPEEIAAAIDAAAQFVHGHERRLRDRHRLRGQHGSCGLRHLRAAGVPGPMNTCTLSLEERHGVHG